MSMRISGGGGADLSRLQALRQQYQAEKKQSVTTPSQPLPDIAQPVREREAAPVSSPARKIPLPYQDIQSVARQTGYVGLTESAIQRAYVMGESLFVDVRA
jgi:hypothetical protein